jgi:hypothetical protein
MIQGYVFIGDVCDKCRLMRALNGIDYVTIPLQQKSYLPPNTILSNVHVDITDYMKVKIKVLEAYGEEMRQPPHSKSIENSIQLNALRGNAVGLEYAEACQVIRGIQ